MGTLNLGSVSLSANGTAFSNSAATWSDAPAGTVIQVVAEHGNTAFSAQTTSYVQTPVTCTITPRVSTSNILVRQCVSSWEGSGAYGYRQVRATGGYTNNDCGTYGDYYNYGSAAYGTRIHEVLVTNHNTTSAIVFTCWGKGGNGNTWYWPNNFNGTMSHKYIMVCTEIAT
mgnify:FL=1|tara:strand:- start:152 stop:664 length:513 start_codon:yes stop_codon:yes gene_type:complete